MLTSLECRDINIFFYIPVLQYENFTHIHIENNHPSRNSKLNFERFSKFLGCQFAKFKDLEDYFRPILNLDSIYVSIWAVLI